MPTLTNRFKTDVSIGSLALQSGYVCMLVGGSLVREAVHALRGLMAAGVAPLRGAGAFVVARALAADPHLGFCCLGGIPLARGGRVDLLLFSRYLWVGSSQVQLAKDDTHTQREREGRRWWLFLATQVRSLLPTALFLCLLRMLLCSTIPLCRGAMVISLGHSRGYDLFVLRRATS